MDIYDPRFVRGLFDEMSSTYEVVNFLSSFGFSERWRQQVVARAGIRPEMVVCDLMCGMGDCWRALARHMGPGDRLVATDFSPGMLAGAGRNLGRLRRQRVLLLQGDALGNPLPDESVDALICGFGVKTLAPAQLDWLVAEVRRVLKPGGVFAFVEISVPRGWIFEWLYMFYLKQVVPVVGKLLLGNPENYRMLGIYAENFGDCRGFHELFGKHGLEARYDRYFYGCASGVSGVKPLREQTLGQAR